MQPLVPPTSYVGKVEHGEDVHSCILRIRIFSVEYLRREIRKPNYSGTDLRPIIRQPCVKSVDSFTYFSDKANISYSSE